jgi:hypothetical protein
MCRWYDIIKINLKEIGREGVGWSYLAQDRDLVNISRPLDPIKEGNFCPAEPLSVSEEGIFFMQLAQFQSRQQSTMLRNVCCL